MLFNPALHLGRTMDGVTINDEEYCALNLPYDAFEKIQKDARIKARLEHHEIKATAIVDRRNHVAAKALSCARDYRRLAATAVGAPRLRSARHSPGIVARNNASHSDPHRAYSMRWFFLFFRQELWPKDYRHREV